MVTEVLQNFTFTSIRSCLSSWIFVDGHDTSQVGSHNSVKQIDFHILLLNLFWIRRILSLMPVPFRAMSRGCFFFLATCNAILNLLLRDLNISRYICKLQWKRVICNLTYFMTRITLHVKKNCIVWHGLKGKLSKFSKTAFKKHPKGTTTTKFGCGMYKMWKIPYNPVKFEYFIYRENGNDFSWAIQKYTKFAIFTGYFFSHFTTFQNQTYHIVVMILTISTFFATLFIYCSIHSSQPSHHKV